MPDHNDHYSNSDHSSPCNREATHNKVITGYAKTIELNPDFTRDIELGDIYCHFARGLAYAKIGNKSEAVADFDVIVRLSGDPELIPKAKQEIERLKT